MNPRMRWSFVAQFTLMGVLSAALTVNWAIVTADWLVVFRAPLVGLGAGMALFCAVSAVSIALDRP